MSDAQGVEGRWRLWVCPEHGAVMPQSMEYHHGCWSTQAAVSVPVVPCDQAAVERVALWLHEVRFGCSGEDPCATCRNDARAVLRAAANPSASERQRHAEPETAKPSPNPDGAQHAE